MNLKKLWLLLAMFFAFVFSGCAAELFSMGRMAPPIVHQPRMDPTNKKAENTLAVNAFGTFLPSWVQTKNVLGGGGIVSNTFRFGGFFSPLFLTANFAGSAGKVNFHCTRSCNEYYSTWLKSPEGKKDYSYWALQEQILVGGEFQLPVNFFLGLSVGVGAFQSGGEHQKQAEKMDGNYYTYGVEMQDGKYDLTTLANLWFGYHLGEKGKYGALTLQASFFDPDIFISSVSLAYFHPTGFHGSLGLKGISVGKSFTF